MSDEVIEQQEELKAFGSRILIHGEPLEKIPDDLYIPPEALEVFLEAFEGPLDLLLYLIKRQNIDVLDIPIAKITAQYMRYIELMEQLDFELAAEYLVMAAMLAEIKSRMLLPKPIEETEEEDPRAELVRRLQEYQRYKEAAENINEIPRRGRDTFSASAKPPSMEIVRPLPQIELQELLVAFSEVLERVELNTSHHIESEPLSVRERMTIILDLLGEGKFVPFTAIFKTVEGRMGVVVTFIAMLELLKGAAIEIVQSQPFAPIHIKAVVV